MKDKLKIEYIDPQKLKPWEHNPRKISDDAMAGLRASIEQFGIVDPFVVNPKQMIIGGHQRCKAAIELGYKEVPVVYVSLSPEEEKALNVTLNNPHIAGNWTADLGDLLGQIKADMPEAYESLMLEPLELDVPEIDSGGGEPDPAADKAPEVEGEPIIQVGDLITLGKHRLLCGDCTVAENVERLMQGKKADMVFTDPPYNVGSDSQNYAATASKSMKKIKEAAWDRDFAIEGTVKALIGVSSDNVTMYIFTSHFLIQRIWDTLKDWADHSSYLVWSKPNPMPSLSKRHPTWNTELCAYASKGSKRTVNFPHEGHFLSCRNVEKSSDGSHPTQKPLALIIPLIEFSSNRHQILIDLFLGSGSTLIACEQLNRICYGMEIDPHYCQVIAQRYIDYTNRPEDVTIERGGKTLTWEQLNG